MPWFGGADEISVPDVGPIREVLPRKHSSSPKRTHSEALADSSAKLSLLDALGLGRLLDFQPVFIGTRREDDFSLRAAKFGETGEDVGEDERVQVANVRCWCEGAVRACSLQALT